MAAPAEIFPRKSRARPANTQRPPMPRRADFRRWWDGQLLLSGLGLVLVSGVAMASAGSTVNPDLVVRHWMWSAIGLVACLAVSRINYLRWADAAAACYALSLLALV